MYTPEEWQKVSQQYAEKLNSIIIAEDVSPPAIVQLQSALDALYTESQLDYARLKSEASRLKNMIKRLGHIYYLEVKNTGKTEKEREALVQSLIAERHTYGDVNVIEALELVEEQSTFMQALTDTIQEKTKRLITILGSLKLEQSIIAVETAADATVRRRHGVPPIL